MASQATADGKTKWSSHFWSAQAVRDTITKSPETIKLVSKEDQVVVTVHKELLCFFSPYYTAALKGSFLEARKDQLEVDLLDASLRNFTNWLYTGEVAHGPLVRLYVFADQVDIIALRRDVVDVVAEQDIYGYADINFIFMNLTQNSPLRRFMLDSYIHHWTPVRDTEDPCPLDSDTDSENLLANFIYEVLKGYVARGVNEDDDDECSCCNDVCQYHEHESKEEWEATCGQKEDSKMPASLKRSE